MKFWAIVLMVVLMFGGSVEAQRKKKKSNGYSNYETKKKLNKQWMKLRNTSLPFATFMFNVGGGPVSLSTNATGVDIDPAIFHFQSGLQVNANIFESFGVHMGLGFRRMDFVYTSLGTFTNGDTRTDANGYWEHDLGNVEISLGGTYYLSLGKRILNCTGFKVIRASTAHVYFLADISYAPSVMNDLQFRGSYNKYDGNELVESNTYGELQPIPTDVRKINRQILFSFEPGFRSQTNNTAFRIAPFFEYQLNQNAQLVNDYTDATFGIMTAGLKLGFEFF